VTQDYCLGNGLVLFSWNYNGASQATSELQISTTQFADDYHDTPGLFFDQKNNSSVNSITLQMVSQAVSPISNCPSVYGCMRSCPSCYGICGCQSFLNFEVPKYYWRVKVGSSIATLPPSWQSAEWPSVGHVMYKHAPPSISFTQSSTSIIPGETVSFIDNSTCYKDDGTSDLCSNMAGITYSWIFGDGSAPESTVGNATHKYNQAGTYSATLQIKESGLPQCSQFVGPQIVVRSPGSSTGGNGVPTWKEVPPQ
jgi:hypothetical protein